MTKRLKRHKTNVNDKMNVERTLLKMLIKCVFVVLYGIIAIAGPTVSFNLDVFSSTVDNNGLLIVRNGTFLKWQELVCLNVSQTCNFQSLGK